MNAWLSYMQKLPSEFFLDNESTLRLLGDQKNGLLSASINGESFMRFSPFCFQAGRLFLFSKDEAFEALNQSALYFIVQGKRQEEGEAPREIATVCYGQAKLLCESEQREEAFSLFEKTFSNHALFTLNSSLLILQLSCQRIAGFSLPS